MKHGWLIRPAALTFVPLFLAILAASAPAAPFPFAGVELPVPGSQGRQVVLEGWEIREPHLVAGLDPHYALGRWRGREVAAVVLYVNFGGSGVYKTLFFMVKKEGRWRPSKGVDLGDRVRIEGVSLGRDGVVVVKMVEHRPEDPLCCPSRRVERRFKVEGEGLVEAGARTLGPSPTPCPSHRTQGR